MILNKNSPTKFPNSAAGRTIAPGSLTFFDCEKNLNGLLDFYSNLQNDFAVAHTPNKKDWSKWLNWTDWKHERKLLPNYRQILGTEVVLEYDYPDRKTNLMVTKKVMEVLRKKGYNYRCYFTGKKSFHVHLMFLVLQELEKEKVKIEEKKRANEIEQKNIEARELICSEIRQAIEASKEGIPNWDNWQGVPHHYAKIAVDYGIINPTLEEKKAVWEKSKLLAIEEMKMDALSDSKTMIQKREIMDALKKIEQGDNSNLEGSSKRIYSKLLLWEYVK